MIRRICSCAIFLSACSSAFGQTAGMISFQGRLKQSGTPINGVVHLKFEIVDTGDNLKAGPFCVPNVQVTNGLVSTKFGPVLPSAFDGGARLLKISICQIANCTDCSTLPPIDMATAPATAEQLNIPGTGTQAVAVDGSGNISLRSGTTDTIKLLSQGSPTMQFWSPTVPGTELVNIGIQSDSRAGWIALRDNVQGEVGVTLSGGNRQMSLHNGQAGNPETITLNGNGNAGGGFFALTNGQVPTNPQTIKLFGHAGVTNYGEIDLGNSSGTRLYLGGGGFGADQLGAGLQAHNGAGQMAIELGIQNSGGRIAVSNGQVSDLETITLEGNPGRIGIGTSTPQESLHIATGGIKFPDGTVQMTACCAAPGGGALVGEVRMWAGSIATVPANWRFCDGSAVSRTTYSALFAAIGTIYGNGDGSTTFNLPDLRDRSPMGAREDQSGTPKTNVSGTLTQSGGAATHTLTVDELPSHSHGEQYLDTENPPDFTVKQAWVIPGNYTNGGGTASYETISPGPPDSLGPETIPLTTTSTGNNQSHGILDPYFAISFIIYTGV